MEGYMSVGEVAKLWELTPRRVQLMCAQGKIEGVTKFGHSWVIPQNAERPKDGRVTTGEYRNWRKKGNKEAI